MTITIENGGILTTVQDEGRFGFEQFGVSSSGPMDFKSMHMGNILVGNDMGESCLEITIMGPAIRFDSHEVVAVTGGDCTPTLNKRQINMYQAFYVGPGDLLQLGVVKNGARSYLCVSGGIKVPLIMNSKSTQVGKNFGGFEGRKLKKGDVLELEKEVHDLPDMGKRCLAPYCFPQTEHEIRVIMGPQDDRFTPEGIETFLNSVYKVGAESDRQGYRLEGPLIKHKTDGNIISDGTVNGSIQVPSDGRPIVLLAEHQTVGGYTKIATVITTDLPVLGQCKVGDSIRFRAVSFGEAVKAYRDYYRELETLNKKLNRSTGYTPGMKDINPNPKPKSTLSLEYKPIKNYRILIGDQIYQVQIQKMED